MELKTLLKELPGLMTISGYTYRSADKLNKMIGGEFDEYYQNRVGSHVFVRRCGRSDAPRIMIDTHYDEVGMMVTKVNKDGFLSITNVGGLDMRILQAAEVVVYGEDTEGNEKEIYGVIVSTPPHLTKPADANKLKEIGELYVDTGYSEDEIKKYVRVGTPVGYRGVYRDLLNNRISGKGFDCKSCSACAVYAIATTPREELAGDVYLVLSNFEEVGGQQVGSVTAAYEIDPDYALVADVTGAVIPGSSNNVPKMGDGASITFAPITDRRMNKLLVKLLEEKGVKLSVEVAAGRTGTNTTGLNLVRAGVPIVDIGLPLRNMHTYNEVIDLADAEAMAEVMRVFITSKEIAEVFGR